MKTNVRLDENNSINRVKNNFALLALTIIGALSLVVNPAFAEDKVPTDQMVYLQDKALHMMSLGEGDFTVIFEAGFGSDLSHWRRVAPAISKLSKVVLYSRAGYGKSDSISKAPTLTETTAELTQFIKRAKLKPPFILVGHSYGSHIVRTYAAQNPEKIAGLVFVEPANEQFMLKLKQLDKEKTERFLAVYEKMVPENLRAENAILMALDEKGKLPDFGPLPNVPAAILTSMVQEHPQFIIHSIKGKNIWRALHTQLFNQFTNARHLVTMNSGHNIALQEPELVIGAISKVIEQAGLVANKKYLDTALINANRLIKQDKKAQAMENIANAFRKLLLNVEQINTLGYEYLSEHNKNPDLAGIILKYNVLNNSRSANVYDSYGEALLAMNEPAAAKSQFLKAIELIELQDKDHRALNGFKANLVKAQLALKAQK